MLCSDDLIRRRDFLRIGGGLAVSAFAAPEFLSARAQASYLAASGGRAKSCILVYLLGGPPHLDMFDLKPEAPAEIRGPFHPIATNVPGVKICELLPRLAPLAGRYALIRSVSRENNNHTPMIYYTLTGRETAQPDRDNDIRPPQRDDSPHTGSVLSKFKDSAYGLPGYIALPEVAIRSSIKGKYKRARLPLRGGGAGFLGAQYEALKVNGPPGTREALPALSLPEGVSPERFERRAALLELLDGGGPSVSSTETLGTIRQTAMHITGSAARGNLQAFSLDGEPDKVRERYGRHRFGQTMLLARRLAEAGVPMIAVHWNEMTVCDGWDTHSKNFEALRTELLPMLDQGLSALMEDLDSRGLLDETLIVCQGEFGRTPKINGNAGRDHWGSCSTTLLAGGGIRGGQVYGASDKHGAYPVEKLVDPADVQATLYHCLGLNPEQTMIVDHRGRPLPISTGRVLDELL